MRVLEQFVRDGLVGRSHHLGEHGGGVIKKELASGPSYVRDGFGEQP
jgi:hypothetical protein